MAPKNKQTQAGRPSEIDLALVESVLAFMGKHGLEEFEYEREGLHIRLKKHSTVADAARGTLAAHQAAAPSVSGGREAETGEAKPSPSEARGGEDLHIVKSPIVGTYYAAPSPGADLFVQVGSLVETGQVLCIIEAMKLMNEIESDVTGEVVRIFAENGQPVEYAQPLFGIHPRGKK